MGILAFHEGEWISSIESLNPHPQGDKNPTWKERDVSTRLAKCQTQTISFLHKNNGIKSKDLLCMLLRIGFTVEEIDSDLVQELDALASERGTFAHNAVRATTTQPDPADVKSRIAKIITKLQVLDAKIEALV